MTTLFITQPIEDFIESLEWDKKVLSNIHGESSKEVEVIEDKLRCAKMYQKILEKRDEFDKFKYMQWKNPQKYLSLCQDYIKDIPGIDFVKKTKRFRVRLRTKGKSKYIGEFDTPKDAVDILKIYIND